MNKQQKQIPRADDLDPSSWTAGRILSHGIRRGLLGALWVYKILVPISFLTLLLQFSHILDRLDGWLGPVMGLIHLPAKAAMPLLAGFLTGIYGGVAAMAVMGLSPRESTLIAIFLLISHNMIQESAVQGLAGIHPLKAAAFRLTASVMVVWVLGYVWSPDPSTTVISSSAAMDSAPFMTQFQTWVWQTVKLCAKVLAILLCIMTAVTWMKVRQISRHLVRFITPVLRAMGLGSREGLLWLTAILFGVTYGSAVIIDETRQGHLTRAELERLHLSIGINHAMIEDPALFLPLGIHPFWLWIPRLVTAFLAVHLLRLFRWVFKKHSGKEEPGFSDSKPC